MNRRAVRTAVFDILESRLVRSTTTPTAVEQLMLELINRARSNPSAEASNYSTYSDPRGVAFSGDLNEGLPAGTISATPKQPLAFNSNLIDAARGQSNYLGTTATSVTHTGSGGSSWPQRIAAAGYSGATATDENIDVYFSLNALNAETTALQQHADLFTDLVLSDRAHRRTMLNDTFKEIGIGITNHQWNRPNGINNGQEDTENYATRNNQAYLTGVAFSDGVKKNNFYNIGEGLGGVTIKATRKSDGQVYQTTTWSSGGYTLALPAGTYTITGSGGSLGSTITYTDVTVTTRNVKKDFITGHTGGTDTPFASVTSRTLVVTGTSGNDVISVSLVGANYIATMNGSSQAFATSLIDKIAINCGAGNDKASNITSIPAFMDGGDGKDILTGGGGNDSLYGGGSPDNINGGLGDDQLVGAGGGDFIQGGAGNDKIYGGAGNDVLNGGSNNDRIYAGDGNDSVSGENGNDILYGEAGADILNGGGNTDASDNDTLDTRIAVELFV